MNTEPRATADGPGRHALLVVGRVGAPHGVRGEVTVEVCTDEPAARFVSGAVLHTDSPAVGPLTVRTARWHGDRLLLRFADRADRSAVEALPGTSLLVDSADLAPGGDRDEFHDHELLDLAVVTSAGENAGDVVDVLHLPGQDVLVVGPPGGGEVLVPFVSALVLEVDRAERRVVIDPPPGLMDME